MSRAKPPELVLSRLKAPHERKLLLAKGKATAEHARGEKGRLNHLFLTTHVLMLDLNDGIMAWEWVHALLVELLGEAGPAAQNSAMKSSFFLPAHGIFQLVVFLPLYFYT